MKSKYITLWIIQGNYGQGWEDIDAGETWKEIRGNLALYRKNSPQYQFRSIRRRELRENHNSPFSDSMEYHESFA